MVRLLKSRTATAARSRSPAKPVQFDDNEESKDVDVKITSTRVPIQRAGESPQTRFEKKMAPGSLHSVIRCAGEEKKYGRPNASQGKNARTKDWRHERVQERTGGNAGTCTVKPSPAQTAPLEERPAFSLPGDHARSPDPSPQSHLARREAMKPELVAHADFGETEPRENWSENVAALTSAAWAWLLRAPQAACCYS
jgi:hypothetical protein